jgi:hypothetical protein
VKDREDRRGRGMMIGQTTERDGKEIMERGGK